MKRKEIRIGSIVLFLVLLLPYIFAALYANPSGDDFAAMDDVINAGANTYLGKVLFCVADLYRTWQGTYFGGFCAYIGSGVFDKFGLFGIHLEYVITICLYFSVFFLFIRELLNCVLNNNTTVISLIISSILLFVILYDSNVSDLFYWHSGLSIYTIPITCGLAALIFLMDNKLGVWRIVFAAILAFLCSGGALNVSAFICLLSLLVLAYRVYTKKRVFDSIIVFGTALMGAIINVLAPGN